MINIDFKHMIKLAYKKQWNLLKKWTEIKNGEKYKRMINLASKKQRNLLIKWAEMKKKAKNIENPLGILTKSWKKDAHLGFALNRRGCDLVLGGGPQTTKKSKIYIRKWSSSTTDWEGGKGRERETGSGGGANSKD